VPGKCSGLISLFQQAEIYCSLNRKSEAEAMFRNVMSSPNLAEKELAFRKFGRFMIKIGDWEKV